MKTCSKCKQEKPPEAFSKDSANPDQLRYCCRECMSVAWKALYAKDPERWRARSKKWARDNPEKQRLIRKHADLQTNYGIGLVDFQRMFDAQKGLCAICEEKMEPACVDHCHATGKIRGLLCSACNRGLGFFREQARWLRAAAGYLEKGVDKTEKSDTSSSTE